MTKSIFSGSFFITSPNYNLTTTFTLSSVIKEESYINSLLLQNEDKPNTKKQLLHVYIFPSSWLDMIKLLY